MSFPLTGPFSNSGMYLLWYVACRVTDSELSSDPAANLLTSASEEAQKVARNEGKVIQHELTSEDLTAFAVTQLEDTVLLSCMVFPKAVLCLADPAVNFWLGETKHGCFV